MPPMDNLRERINGDADWLRQIKLNTTATENAAIFIPLIHVTRKNLHNMLVEDNGGLDPSKMTPSPNTEKAEKLFGLGRCIYLFAGRCYPVVGGIAFAFDRYIETSLQEHGSVTPFDTGSWVHEPPYIHAKILYDDDSLREFVQQSIITLDCWREDFSSFLSAYFTQPSEYWHGRPCREDPDGIYNETHNTWRAWTFEIRFRDCALMIDDMIAWCGQMDNYWLTSKAILDGDEGPGSSYDSTIASFIRKHPSLISDVGSMHRYSEFLEDWAEKVTCCK